MTLLRKVLLFVAVFLLVSLGHGARAIEILSAPFNAGLGIGAGIRAENQYAEMQPTVNSTFSLSQDFRWRRLQSLIEWTRWTEHSSGANQSMNHRQDQISLFGRYEFIHLDWIGFFGGAGVGIQQDRVESSFGQARDAVTSDWGKFWGSELGVTFYIAPRFEGQVNGRLISQPYDSRWTQWVGARLSYQIF